MNEDEQAQAENKGLVPVKHKMRALKFKLHKTITLDQIADQLAQDIGGAIYSAINNRTISGLYVGDDLAEVVDQGLSRDGMSDDLNRMSSTRIRINVAVDVSGSMFARFMSRPIVRAMTLSRVLLKAFNTVKQQFPGGVFDFSMWLFAASNGKGCFCLTHTGYDEFDQHDGPNGFSKKTIGLNARSPEEIDRLLESTAQVEPWWSGASTELAPMLEKWAQWTLDRGEPGTHNLDIVISDGAIYDIEEASVVQLFRITGKYLALLFTIGNWSYEAPNGFTSYAIQTNELEPVMRETLDQFVKTLY
jgi:hypothetical protein